MDSVLFPTKFEITAGTKPNEGILVLEPCYYGYGTTVGNALRRVLLSSLPGAAVTAVKIRGVQHEFSTIPNVKEDVLEIILNLKLLRVKLFTEEPVKLSLRVKGEKEVTAEDFEKNANVEIINKDLKIATLTDKKADLEMEIIIENGRGYVPSEARANKTSEIGLIMIDALFSPVRNVGYKVQNVRVGEITNFDKLIMTIETDGTISPEDAVATSAKILLDHFNILVQKLSGEEVSDVKEIEETATLPVSEIEIGETEEDVEPEAGVGEETEKPKRGRPKKVTKKKS